MGSRMTGADGDHLPMPARRDPWFAMADFLAKEAETLKTVAPSSKRTPCFRALASAFASSHSNVSATIFSADYTDGPIVPLLQLQQLDVATPFRGQCARSRRDLTAPRCGSLRHYPPYLALGDLLFSQGALETTPIRAIVAVVLKHIHLEYILWIQQEYWCKYPLAMVNR